MSVPFEGFTGPSYQLMDKYAAIERCVNWYPVANESQTEQKWKLALEPSPGNAEFSQLPVPAPFNQPNRGLIENRGRVFGVNGNVVFEIDSAGAYTRLGTVENDSLPVSMVANGNGQIFIASGGSGYVIPAVGPMIGVGSSGFLGASYATFQDGYILTIVPDSNKFQISGDDDTPLGDARIWSASNVSVQAGQADKLKAIISSREYVRLLGHRRSQVYQNVGNHGIGGFPFQSYNQTFIETGIAGPFSLADLGDSLIWIGEDARGQRACWRDHAFQPQRVSNFAVERFWQEYVSVDDAVAFTYIWNGHLMYQVTFPSAYESAVLFPLGATHGAYTSATWVLDVTMSDLLGRSIWHERAYQNALGYTMGRPEMFHCYAFGKHLVGSGGVDGNPGAIYQYEDSPYVMDDPAANPQLLLRWSNDAGNTWSLEQNIPIGQIGDFGRRVYWNRGGYGRDRVYWVRIADAVFGTDCGTDAAGAQALVQVVRDRICPHLYETNKRILYDRIEFDLPRGSGRIGLVGASLDIRVCA